MLPLFIYYILFHSFNQRAQKRKRLEISSRATADGHSLCVNYALLSINITKFFFYKEE